MADVSVPTTPTNPAAELVAVVEDLVERQRQILGALVATTHPLKNDVQAVLLGMRGVVTKLRNGAGDDAATPDDAAARHMADVTRHPRFAELYAQAAHNVHARDNHDQGDERAEAAVPAVHAEWDADGDFRSADCLAKGCPLCASSDWAKRQAPSSVQAPATPDDTALTVAMSAARKVSILPPAPHIVIAMLDALAKAGFLAPTAVISDLRATAADLLTADDVTDHDRVAAQTLTDYADRLGKAAPSSVQGDTTPEAACVHGQTADLTGLAAREAQS